MKEALATLKGSGAVRIAIRGLGFFPNAKRPTIFWTGVDGGTYLATLASRIDQACAQLGVQPEKRPYSPHLTLARIASPSPPASSLGALHAALAKLPSTEFGEFEATAFHLYLSQPGRGGSVTTPR